MKYAQLMKYFPERPTLMEALILKHSLLSRGFKEAGVSSINKSSPNYNKKLLQKLEKQAEEVMLIPAFRPGLSLYLGGQEEIIEGVYSFYAVFSEEEEEIPDTLPGGFKVESQPRRQFDLFENPHSRGVIKRKLPSELLYLLSHHGLNVLPEQVTECYFDSKKHSKHFLTMDDLTTLSRMEQKKTLDLNLLRRKGSSEEDRKARNSLEQRLARSPLITKVARGPVYTLSSEAMNGRYVAEINEYYLPLDWRNRV